MPVLPFIIGLSPIGRLLIQDFDVSSFILAILKNTDDEEVAVDPICFVFVENENRISKRN